MNSKRIGLYLKALAIICAGLVIISCNKKETNIRSDIVAQIGDHSITAKDFQLNYEFGFSHLKKGKNRKHSYLEKMISEKLLALEGYRLGLDKLGRVQQLEKQLLEELLVEELLFNEVDEKVQVAPQEIMDAISKSNVQFKLRYWVEPSLKGAETVRAYLHDQGDTGLVQETLTHNRELEHNIEASETDYLTWLDIPPELLKEIKELEIGEISKPFELDQVYLILQVTDIKNGILSDYDFNSAYNRFKQILVSREIKKKTALYVSQYLTPKDIVTKGSAFNDLALALFERYQNKSSLGSNNLINIVEQADDNNPALQRLKNRLNDILISYDNGSWTLKDFIERFDPSAINSNGSDIGLLKRELNHEIASMIRKYFLAKEAVVQGLDKSESLVKELNTWRDKWVYEETYKYLTHDLKITEDDVRNYYEDHKSQYNNSKEGQATFNKYEQRARQDAIIESRQMVLTKKVQSLKKDYQVTINQEILDTISVIEYEKSRWANLLLFKAGSGRQAVPVVDPQWSF